ncbi:hypothetical protein [Rhodococcus opacus]|uniref:hypothetical protein n=1 Tax=Rhodococcus opacus TaxID=37919 RepID=UPI000AE51818|nr:hypothetical protein [Rhodococcus opacus]
MSPPPVVGGLIGGTIGGLQGAYMGTWVPTPIPGLPIVTSGVAGTAGGAGDRRCSRRCAGRGDRRCGRRRCRCRRRHQLGAGDLTEPTGIAAPDVEHDAIARQTAATLTVWENSGPVGAAAAGAVQDVVESAPVIDQQVRDFVSDQPGGCADRRPGRHRPERLLHHRHLGLAGNLLSTVVGDGIAHHGN